MDGSTSPTSARQARMGLVAKSPHDRLQTLSAHLWEGARFDWLRAPEIGAVMVRGRIGGTGGPFNLGEMTITRATLRLATGEVGHGYVQGRSKEAASAAALVDALMQTDAAGRVRAEVLAPLAAESAARRESRAARAAATKVEFFTLVRGED